MSDSPAADTILTSVDDGVATITLNRPERLNAVTADMVATLGTTLRALEDDDAVGAIVLTGAGRAFCAGGDVSNIGSADAEEALDARRRKQVSNEQETSARLWSMAKPTIAMLPGAAAGAGLSLALACDLRYAADRAVLITSFVSMGLAGDYGAAWFLTRHLGSARARELLMLSERVTAARALELGLLTSVHPADELKSAVDAVARKLANGPRLALGLMKENLNRAAFDSDLPGYLEHEVDNHLACVRSDDHAEAARAFAEKRPPRFTGH